MELREENSFANAREAIVNDGGDVVWVMWLVVFNTEVLAVAVLSPGMYGKAIRGFRRWWGRPGFVGSEPSRGFWCGREAGTKVWMGYTCRTDGQVDSESIRLHLASFILNAPGQDARSSHQGEDSHWSQDIMQPSPP